MTENQKKDFQTLNALFSCVPILFPRCFLCVFHRALLTREKKSVNELHIHKAQYKFHFLFTFIPICSTNFCVCMLLAVDNRLLQLCLPNRLKFLGEIELDKLSSRSECFLCVWQCVHYVARANFTLILSLTLPFLLLLYIFTLSIFLSTSLSIKKTKSNSSNTTKKRLFCRVRFSASPCTRTQTNFTNFFFFSPLISLTSHKQL